MRCNQFGCECCTCFACNNYYENCVCEVKKQADKFIEKYREHDNPIITEAIEILKELK